MLKKHSSDLQRPSPDRTGLPSGDQSEVEPPGPIPNPEVKRLSANGSGTIGPVRVGRRQVYAPSMETWTGLFFCSSSSKHDGKMAEFELEIVQIAVSAGFVDHPCNEVVESFDKT